MAGYRSVGIIYFVQLYDKNEKIVSVLTIAIKLLRFIIC
jgi:hypothetical protein